MKIFISWSGDRSRQLATALHRWLPIVIQSIEPYLSSEDIEKGTRWSTSISQELETSNFGLLCLTPENLTAPWIYFEAGALAKVVKQSHVVPLLFGLAPSDIQGPLTQFQSASLEHDDMLRLLKAINVAGGDTALEESRLETAFSALWGQFHQEIGTSEGRMSSLGVP
jgi:TIR domain